MAVASEQDEGSGSELTFVCLFSSSVFRKLPKIFFRLGKDFSPSLANLPLPSQGVIVLDSISTLGFRWTRTLWNLEGRSP